MALYPRSVANFYREFLAILRSLGIDVTINPLPQEIANPIPCDEDHEHAAYDAAFATGWWRILRDVTPPAFYDTGDIDKSLHCEFV